MRHTFFGRTESGPHAHPGSEEGCARHSRSRLPAGARQRQAECHGGTDRKALQLCHQVAVTLQEVLADCGDAVLQALRVVVVQPAPDASRLLVTVAPETPPEESLDPNRVQERLAHAAGHLRSEVASAITRKRAPVLIYRVTLQPDAFFT